MRLDGKTIGWGVTGSHCSYDEVIPQVERTLAAGARVIPVMSHTAVTTTTRFGSGENLAKLLAEITGNEPITSIVDAEPTGQQKTFDCFVIAPLTGNSLARFANAFTDSAVLMAAKGTLRNLRPVVLAVSTNDALGNNARNLSILLNTKNVYFVPFGQDNPEVKPNSCVAAFDLIPETIAAALEGRQLQPILIERATPRALKDDGPEMRILVQKFGGTSLADGPGRAAVVGHVRAAREEGYAPVVVVSAMGRRGDPYATDTLLDLVSDTPDLPLRELDLLVSCGEVIAAVVLAGLLRSEGIPASVLTGAQAGIMTDGQHGRATVLAVRPEAVRALLEEGQVPVVTGFQGATADGEITTLGRGGSDTTAAVLGVALGCELIEIYTDVDGIKTADPSIVPEAATLRNVTYGEAVELAHLGAKVIHPRAVQVAMASRVPIRVRRNGSGSPGTLISSAVSEGPGAVLYPDRTVTGIACVRNQTYVKVEAGKTDEGLLDLFDRLGSAGISVDMIHINGERVAFTVAGDQGRQTERILNMLELRYALETGCAKVSAVGAGMHGVPGVVSRVLRALSSAGVEVLATSDSHANISCLVREGDVQPAVSALHKEFCLAEQQREAVPFKE